MSTTRLATDERNRTTSRAEVAAFIASKPSPYFAYWNARGRWKSPGVAPKLIPGDTITTWPGDELAKIVWTGEPFYCSFGDRRQNFRAVTADAKATYAGTAYLSAGDYVRMRTVKP